MDDDARRTKWRWLCDDYDRDCCCARSIGAIESRFGRAPDSCSYFDSDSDSDCDFEHAHAHATVTAIDHVDGASHDADSADRSNVWMVGCSHRCSPRFRCAIVSVSANENVTVIVSARRNASVTQTVNEHDQCHYERHHSKQRPDHSTGKRKERFTERRSTWLDKITS